VGLRGSSLKPKPLLSLCLSLSRVLEVLFASVAGNFLLAAAQDKVVFAFIVALQHRRRSFLRACVPAFIL